MSQFTIVWDVLMTGEAVMDKKAGANLAVEMESYASGIEFQTVQRWNYVATGKRFPKQDSPTAYVLHLVVPILSTSNHHFTS